MQFCPRDSSSPMDSPKPIFNEVRTPPLIPMAEPDSTTEVLSSPTSKTNSTSYDFSNSTNHPLVTVDILIDIFTLFGPSWLKLGLLSRLLCSGNKEVSQLLCEAGELFGLNSSGWAWLIKQVKVPYTPFVFNLFSQVFYNIPLQQ